MLSRRVSKSNGFNLFVKLFDIYVNLNFTRNEVLSGFYLLQIQDSFKAMMKFSKVA
jgi:hypothetical protein